ncbi:unnamed protein product [Acanthoscelides obtectus]|uniref:Uncharacterized protein n=1 Tax=Acanthoscelides obtectus TaxID=200917 RepID=A0A9P0LEP8_ACAOB|nr:unnamed protein product [Acanthoscelides obtectus]CAK1637611.1 hypothetical protein AOBTE_LOCUS10086 [Acanthoscelides obtectus]
MGNNVFSLTDREYMQKLQEKLLEDYADSMNERIKNREIKLHKSHRPTYPQPDEAPDPGSDLTMEKEHELSPAHVKLCLSYEKFLGSMESEESEQNEFIMDPEQLEVIHYEDPLLKQLRNCETVEELYEVADQIIGSLRTVEEKDTTSQKITREAEG